MCKNHPEATVYSRGLCQKCYSRWYATNRDRVKDHKLLKEEAASYRCEKHPERKAQARGMCRACYQTWYRKTHPEYAETQRELQREYFRKPGTKRKDLERLLATMSCTLTEYDNQREQQNGMCKICKEKVKLVIDHSHSSGKFRGLICNACNKGLGLFKDSPIALRVAALYLEEST